MYYIERNVGGWMLHGLRNRKEVCTPGYYNSNVTITINRNRKTRNGHMGFVDGTLRNRQMWIEAISVSLVSFPVVL